MSEYLYYGWDGGKSDFLGFEKDGLKYVFSKGQICIKVGETIELSRNYFSTIPLFYTFTPNGFFAARSWKTVLEFLVDNKFNLRINLNYINDYLMFQCPLTDETFCRDIYLLRGGETVSIGKGGKLSYTFLDKNEEFPNNSLQDFELVSTLKAKFQEDSYKEAVFHVSAGLDSSLLVLLAKEAFDSSSVKVATCRTLGKGASEELEIVNRFASENNLQLKVYSLEDSDLFQEGREFIKGFDGYPIAHPSHLTRYLLDRCIVNDKVSVIVTGRGPDELLAGYQWHGPEFQRPKDHLRRIMSTPKETLQELFLEPLYCKIKDNSLNNYQGIMKTTSLSIVQRLNYDRWTIGEAWDIIDDALARKLEVEYKRPFLDCDIAAALMKIPVGKNNHEDANKMWLRDTFREMYPDYILEQPKRGLSFDVNQYFKCYSRKELMDNLCDFQLVRDIFRKEKIELMVDAMLSNEKNYGWQLWSIYICALFAEEMIDCNKSKRRSFIYA